MKTPTFKVAVFGATGSVGKHFVRQALDAGHDLRVLVRNASKLEHQEHPRLQVVVGNATKPGDVADVVAGVDVVVSCLGNVDKSTIMTTSFENILTAAASQQDIPRCILITSVGFGGTSWLIKRMFILFGGNAFYQDYEMADRRVIDESIVPCVLVRPYSLIDKLGTGRYHASEKQNATFMRPIARADVATFLVDAVSNNEWDRKPGIQLGG